jgi:hypothetical protein
VSIASIQFNSKGYDSSKSKNSRPGPDPMSSYIIANAYLAGINDRSFTGSTVVDKICPQDVNSVCNVDGIEFFKMDDQISGDKLISLGRLGIDCNPNIVLPCYSAHLKK